MDVTEDPAGGVPGGIVGGGTGAYAGAEVFFHRWCILPP